MKSIKFQLEQIKKIYQFSKELKLSDLLPLFKSAKRKIFSKNEIFLSAGSKHKEVFLIRKGLVRLYMVKENGEEFTIGFRCENQIIANYDAILFEEASRSYLQAIEPTIALSLEYDEVFNIAAKSPELMKNFHLAYKELLKTTIRRLESFVLNTAEERYINYVKNNPALAKRIQDKYLANYLGLNPVSLSRIKARIESRE